MKSQFLEENPTDFHIDVPVTPRLLYCKLSIGMQVNAVAKTGALS